MVGVKYIVVISQQFEKLTFLKVIFIEMIYWKQ